ncbi:MAG: hypothetical protein V3S51_00330, partial [Dehalococcoidia bacterium]
ERKWSEEAATWDSVQNAGLTFPKATTFAESAGHLSSERKRKLQKKLKWRGMAAMGQAHSPDMF